ncbi:DNA primase [Sporobacter termitidis DSM 10068]|uniref:DNA primase n=1 Tax=Sporobacter termitidis DSM 10068 TaxID=1123282 RepID=A0A1M5TC29_9FIRM|nr:DNA primase [Sporobacter termitidis]SHH48241.1 DNA primase [Sporobacter termitidis DSM 10068]
MAFPELFLDELVRKNDIVDVVGSYVRLTKKTGNNLFGLCPFHSEKTPSFSVNVDKQIYHCFGCGKGGGVVNFIMEIENLSFPDAVHVLAKRAGMTVPDETTSKETQSRRARLLELNRDAARFFYASLLTPQGETARKYIAKREISKAMVTRFGLGVALDSWSALYEAMTHKGYTKQELLDAGLVKLSRKDGSSVYDAFRNRLMFPVIDVRGSIIGFSGRILGDGEPKYLNSPDTLVFEKSRNLFALNLAKKTKSGVLILTEGNVDVVALHQAGFDSAVASLGTSLTEEQVRLMTRYTHDVIIAYDMDEAGTKASQRAIGMLEKAGLGVKVLRMRDAKDPDEFIKKFGRDAFALLIESSEHHIDYRLHAIRAKYDLGTDEGRLNYLGEATDMLSRLQSAVEREIFAAKVAEAANVSQEAVTNEVKKAFKRRLSAEKKKQDVRDMNVSAGFQPGDRTIRYENVYSAAAEEGVIRLLVLDGELIETADSLDFEETEFTSPFLQKIFEAIKKRRRDGLEASPASILAELTSAEASRFSMIIEKPEALSSGTKAMQDYIEKIRAERLKRSAREDPLAVLQKYRDKTGCGG